MAFFIIYLSSASCLYPGWSVSSGACVPYFFSILETADGVLDFAFNLVGLAVGLQLGIAYCLADGLLGRALDLFRRSRDPILIHDYRLLRWT
jgi:hypothetical protein